MSLGFYLFCDNYLKIPHLTYMTKKELFKLYFPKLSWAKYKDSDFWIEVCLRDHSNKIYAESHDEPTENDRIKERDPDDLYTDKPGPVG